MSRVDESRGPRTTESAPSSSGRSATGSGGPVSVDEPGAPAVRLPDQLRARGARRRARGRHAPAADAEGPQPGRLARGRAGRQAGVALRPAARDPRLSRSARRRRARHRRVPRLEHRPRAGPLVAVHRERGRRRAVADRRVRRVGGGRPLAGAHARRAWRRRVAGDGPAAALRPRAARRLGPPCERLRRRSAQPVEHRRAASASASSAARYDAVAEQLAALAPTFIHGEFYPSNVLVQQGGRTPRVCPIDWEIAAIGPGLLDLAALSVGKWTERRARRAWRSPIATAAAPVAETASHLSDDGVRACARLRTPPPRGAVARVGAAVGAARRAPPRLARRGARARRATRL